MLQELLIQMPSLNEHHSRVEIEKNQRFCSDTETFPRPLCLAGVSSGAKSWLYIAEKRKTMS